MGPLFLIIDSNPTAKRKDLIEFFKNLCRQCLSKIICFAFQEKLMSFISKLIKNERNLQADNPALTPYLFIGILYQTGKGIKSTLTSRSFEYFIINFAAYRLELNRDQQASGTSLVILTTLKTIDWTLIWEPHYTDGG